MCESWRDPIFCILPPQVLRAISQNGSPKQRTNANETLALDATFRSLRENQVIVPVQRRGAAPQGQQHRTIYDAKTLQQLPGTLVRSEGDPASADVAVNEAYGGLGSTYDLFWDIFARDSIDDAGLPLDAVVHFGKNYDNAFWDGARMVFGDGDNDLFQRFTISLDVIGHELTHGVTEHETQLMYQFQSGALNESISDVFGSLVKQYKLGQTAKQADWLIGAGLFTKKVKGVALRSMKAPGTAFDDPVLGKDNQPAHMKDYVHTFSDNGGVHTNSGIPNHAFYLLASKLGGNAWDEPGRIWYETLRDPRMKPNTGLRRFASLTTMNARRLYGTSSPEQKAVKAAWAKVGITVV